MERPANRLNRGNAKSNDSATILPQITSDEAFYQSHRMDMMRRHQEDTSRDKCPSCGQARLDAQNTMELDREVTNWIRNSNSTQLDSCILCVEKHIGRAMVAYDELCSSDNSGTAAGDAAINPYKARILVIGHLGHAIEESYEYAELHSLLQSDERAFRYSCKVPQWAKIVKLIEEEKKNQGHGIKPIEEAEKQQP
jgi:hypothetical protein